MTENWSTIHVSERKNYKNSYIIAALEKLCENLSRKHFLKMFWSQNRQKINF